MYRYIFWIVFSRNINRNKSEWLSRNNASGVVFIALLVHIMLVAQILKRLFSIGFHEKIGPNKGVLTILFLLCIFLVFRYFTKARIAKLEEKYQGNENWYVEYGSWIVATIIFIPLLVFLLLG